MDGTYKKIGETANTSYNVKGLTNGTEYGIYVIAYVGGKWIALNEEHIAYAILE